LRISRGEGLGLLYPILWLVVRTLCSLAFRLRVEGLENVPSEGAALISPNHRSAIDPPLMSVLLPRPLYHMAKAELFPKIGWLISRLGAFPVQRGSGDLRAMRKSLRLLREGRLICVFPEGTRSRTAEMGPVRPGASYLAYHTGAPVIPVGISGTYGFRRPVTVRFGKPLELRGTEEDGPMLMEAIRTLVETQPGERI